MGGIVFGWINDRIKEGINFLIEFLQILLLKRPPTGDSTFEQLIYGLSWGYGEQIAIWAVIILVFVAMFNRGYFASLMHALVVAVALMSFGAVFFKMWGWLADFELWLSRKAMFHNGDDNQSLIVFPTIDNVLLSALGLGTTGILGFAVALMFFLFMIASVGAIAAFLPVTGLTALGDRPKKFWNILFAVLIVARVFGRPAAIFMLEIGQWAQDSDPLGLGNTSLGIFITTTGSLLMVFAAVKLLYTAAYHTPAFIKGKVSGASKVSGDVKAKLEDGQKVTTEQARAEYNRATPMPVVMAEPPRKSLFNEARDTVVSRAATAAQAAAATYSPSTAHISTRVIEVVRDKMSSDTPKGGTSEPAR